MKFTTLIVAAAIVLTAAGAFAETVVNGNGVASGTSQNQVIPLGEKHLLVKAQSSYEKFAMEAADHPYNGASGECFGSFEMKIPSASGSGSCIFSDASGDISATRFDVTGMTADGAVTGTWTVIGGTGKFAGATGGGQFHSLTDRETGSFENTVTGAMVMK